MKKLILLLVTVLAVSAATTLTFTEKFTITGTITDGTGEPLIGASVLIQGTTNGVVTDFDGNFSISTQDSCVTLVLSYTGFSTVEKKACAGKENKFILEEGMHLEEVTVTALGLKKDKSAKSRSKSKGERKIRRSPKKASADKSPSPPPSSAIKVVTADDIRALPTRDVDALSGKVAGISSDPAKGVSIRGARTEAATYYIDGVKVSGGLVKETGVTEKVVAGTPASYDSPVKTEMTKSVEEFEDSPVIEIVEDADVVDVAMDEAIIPADEEVMPAEEPSLSAGQLTAGEWSDLQNWEDWKTTAGEDLMAMESIWNIDPGQRYSVTVKNEKGIPIPNAVVTLLGAKGDILWKSKTNNTGRAELFYDDDKERAAADADPQKISVNYEGESIKLDKISTYEKGVNEVTIASECPEFQKTEILFVVDATGSMGDEIRYLQAELGDVIKRVQNLDFIGELNTGSVFYRDIGDEYVIRTQNLSPDTKATLDFISRQSANGGGDGPEAVETALEEAIMKQNWSEDAVARIAFLLLDAPPHQTEEIKVKMRSLAQKAAEKGIRIVPVLASGSQSSCEFLMRSIALTTNSRFLFLTDDSGIGNSHAEPSVGAYDVVFLNDLIFRLIVEFSAYDTCKDEDQQNQASAQNIGTEDTFKASCYPLPANSYVFVDLEKDVDKLEVVDLQGQLLLTKSAMTRGISTVFIDNLPPGTYIFKFIRDKEMQSVKVIKSGV